jgi:hypothetical protein
MAWEELLKLHETQEDGLPLTGIGETRENVSLIRKVGVLYGQTVTEHAPLEEDDDTYHEPVHCADGYVRRSPVQPYLTAEDFNRRRVRKIVTVVVGVCFVALLVLALVRAGLFRLR